jgi:DNA-binding MarR family transcriptional regulator
MKPRTPAPPVSPLDAHLGFWMRFVSNRVSGEFERAVEARGVSVSEWVALRTLYDQAGSTHAELMGALGMTKGAVSKVVSRLQDKGLVTRAAHAADARAQVLALTRAGRALVPALARDADANDARFFGHLTARQRRELETLLEDMARLHQLEQVPVA